MTKIKNWADFSESISGWELVGKDMGPNYPSQKLPTTLTSSDTNLLLGIDGNFYSESDFQELFNQKLKTNKLDPNLNRFTKTNLDTLLSL